MRLLLAYASGATELGQIAEAAATLAAVRANLATTTANAEIFALYERLGWAAHLDYGAETPQLRRDGYTYFSQALLLAEESGAQAQIVKMLTQRAFLACWEPTVHAQARAFHWVQPERTFIETLLARVATHIPLSASMAPEPLTLVISPAS